MRKFHVATEEEIKNGVTTDVYFSRTREILEKEGLADLHVTAEITTSSLPKNWEWGILAGVEEAVHLLEDINVDVKSFPEGTLFHASDASGIREPVMVLEGRYVDFCTYETPLLGLLCHASGIATMAARVRRSAGTKTILSFGIRRAHPVLAPMIDRACYIGGFDAVSSLAGARLLGKNPSGTMPHSLIIAMGDQVSAWKSYDEHMPEDVPRIMLVDTYCDEKTEAIMAAEALGGRLFGVRLDTPGSRRGNFADIIKEVRWELDLRGFKNVKIYVSGGLDDESVRTFSDAGADGFGVGTTVSNAPSVDFAMDIVEAAGKPVAKRGKLGGRKEVWRCVQCLLEYVVTEHAPAPVCRKCGSKTKRMLERLLEKGRVTGSLPNPHTIRENVIHQLAKLPTS
ncbi:nicotinate phosphoribosyltransferase [Candidatus Bathyarchaeota archaeon]|nr:MAG: nicotinate phosphoribosyltransferase [Candidatus Bathyarchaeota archaeon]